MTNFPFPAICPVAGVSFKQIEVGNVRLKDKVQIVRDETNTFDTFACKVSVEGILVGYLPRNIAKKLCNGSEAFTSWPGEVIEILVGVNFTGLRIKISSPAGDTPAHQPNPDAPAEPSLRVFARSGRLLGNFISEQATTVLVQTKTGSEVSYPKQLVKIDRA
jgi:hypothetical protein